MRRSASRCNRCRWRRDYSQAVAIARGRGAEYGSGNDAKSPLGADECQVVAVLSLRKRAPSPISPLGG
jgi:hypothetical protein